MKNLDQHIGVEDFELEDEYDFSEAVRWTAWRVGMVLVLVFRWLQRWEQKVLMRRWLHQLMRQSV